MAQHIIRLPWIAQQITSSIIYLIKIKLVHLILRSLKISRDQARKTHPCIAVDCTCRRFRRTRMDRAVTTTSSCHRHQVHKVLILNRVPSKLGITRKVWTIRFHMVKTKTVTCSYSSNSNRIIALEMMVRVLSSSRNNSLLALPITCTFKI
mgnify:CR=1 FL=1